MPRTSQIKLAQSEIIATFNEKPKVLTKSMINQIFESNRKNWLLPINMKLDRFIDFLIKKTELKKVTFPFPQRSITGYTWGDVPLREVLIKLVNKGFYSHYTAMHFHGLTEQIPKTIYLNCEKSEGSLPHSTNKDNQPYEQQAIDTAFSKPPRQTKNEIEIPEQQCRVALLQSAFHRNLGVVDGIFFDGTEGGIPIRVTSLERTMIDIVVRPFYAGGVFEVLKAFENAKGRLSVNKMSAMLKQMSFGYPYHQSIGFYLERAGYKESVINIFRRQEMVYDFYITYQINNPIYCREWKLFVPKGF